MKLDIIVPCYNENENIILFYDEVQKNLSKFDYRIIFVNDGSRDDTLLRIKELNDDKVKYISFSRNFGKESAIYAGLSYSDADYAIVMDVDLQDPPELIPEMFEYIDEYDIVATRRVSRVGEPKIRSFFARLFYRIINKISDVEIIDGARDFRLMKRDVVESITALNEYNRFSKGIFEWVGFNTKWIEYENIERTKGETSWSFWQLFKYSIEGITSFSVAPLYISTVIGIIFSIISFAAIVFIVVRTLLYGDPVSGWPSTMSIILFMGGIQMVFIGILGQYLAKTYIESKNRPIYIVKEDNFD